MTDSRTALVIGEENLSKLKTKKVALFGVGGVGGFVAEALLRSGVRDITLFDGDLIAESNLNRQIVSLKNNVGESKAKAIKDRLISIEPTANITANEVFYSTENAKEYDLSAFDYVIDAIDTISAKIEIIVRCTALGVPVISSMGTGGKTDIEKLKVGDIYKTTVCPLARVMRRELKKRGIARLKVVYSTEEPIKREGREKSGQPSMIFVPAAAGLMIAREVVFDLIGE